jgi:hypothetical protein
MNLQRFAAVFNKTAMVAGLLALLLGFFSGVGQLIVQVQLPTEKAAGHIIVSITNLLFWALLASLLVALVDQILLRFGK